MYVYTRARAWYDVYLENIVSLSVSHQRETLVLPASTTRNIHDNDSKCPIYDYNAQSHTQTRVHHIHSVAEVSAKMCKDEMPMPMVMSMSS